MGTQIYKYMSFPSFIDMVQRKALHFVLTSEWEDTMENGFVYEWSKNLSEPMNRYMSLILVSRAYAQSWTYLEESDAMWRIYGYNNQSLRIRVDISSIDRLEGVKLLPVEYSDKLIPYSLTEMSHSEILLRYIAQKRTAFKHEQEVRLIYVDKINPDKVEPTIRNVYYFLRGKYGNMDGVDVSKINLEELKEYVEYSNICEERKSYKVSFAHISDFIKGVMVHPLAPDWYVDTVKTYCEINKIPFDGKSKLYTL